jgi:hypothetical protein
VLITEKVSPVIYANDSAEAFWLVAINKIDEKRNKDKIKGSKDKDDEIDFFLHFIFFIPPFHERMIVLT